MTAPVLIIDDDRAISRTLQLLLKSKGYVSDTCYSKQEALAALQQAQPPYILILTDIRLPDGNGFELLEEAQSWLGDTKAIILSGLDAEDLREDPRSALAYDIYTKPVPLDQLWTLLKRLVPPSQTGL